MALSLSRLFQVIITVWSIVLMMQSFVIHSIGKSRYFKLLTVAIFLYSVGYLFELDAKTAEAAYMALRMQYLGIPFFAVYFYLFVRDWCHRGIDSGWRPALLFVFPIICMFMAGSYPEVRLFFRGFHFERLPTPHLVTEKGPVFYLMIAYCLAFIAMTIYEVLRYFPKGAQEYNHRLVFLFAVVLPNVAMAVLVVDNVPMQLGPASLVLALVILGSYLIRFRAKDWMPYTAEGILANIDDGYVLIDNEGRFAGANAIAVGYFPVLDGLSAGTPVSEVPNFPPLLLGGDDLPQELTLPAGITLRASVSHITHEGEPVCRCIMLYDITELKGLMDELEEMATHDALTGILNRASFFRMASRDFDLHKRTHTSGALLMIDIDFFKKINDTYGHLFGDTVLMELGRVLQSRMRHTDIGGRYGGEEFAIFLPTTDEQGATIIAEDIRLAVGDMKFVVGGEQVQVSVSIGVAPLEHCRHKVFTDLIADADVALYRAKNTGRNRVLSYEASAPVPVL